MPSSLARVFTQNLTYYPLAWVDGSLSACSTVDPTKLTLASESALPQFVRNAPAQVKDTYGFAHG